MGKATRMACFVNRNGTNGPFRSGSGSSQATIHCKIIAAILLTTTLAGCTGTSRPECERAQNGNDCNSSNSGFSKPSPMVKSDLNKRHKTHKGPKLAPVAPKPEDPPMPPSGNTPAPETPTPSPSPTVPAQENNKPPRGYDALTDGLFGPHT